VSSGLWNEGKEVGSRITEVNFTEQNEYPFHPLRLNSNVFDNLIVTCEDHMLSR
jgi:hypothetical protein